ncbi:Hpt domain-containing protein [Notoacmeibacter sp. MSK16QG-6]|uniref:Hpt domain-containing protein n=1 Tax=Notoacmeibacter sp. MSK16QG-6 TaxID=2957982 RepID=UPI00209CF3A0|nr:Hpt domain-containing protein [Notoacmeibacter sp. MSK16QG-6]MCP1197911.1 Hpt domain-containing protein [Notoacmeibacter sp. MSK16QG-6]
MILARKIQTVAFDRPGGERCAQSKGRPIDLDHLSEQTFGDRALCEEVLRLFCTQIQQTSSALKNASAKERHFLAHAVKGSARGVGAMELADMAARLENDCANDEALNDLFAEIERVREFCASILR